MNKTSALPALAFICILSIFSGAPTRATEELVIGPAVRSVLNADVSTTLKTAREVERAYVDTIKKALPAFVFVDGGSAVLISPDGYVVTNHHVVQDEKYMLVRNNYKTYLAVTQGIDPRGDIALLKLKDISSLKSIPAKANFEKIAATLKDVSNMPYLDLADSDNLQIGQKVFAIGNPFDTAESINDPTVTTGVISALHRFESNYRDAIQTDASINPGNSGGPLITMDGKLAGINGLIVTRYGNAANTGVALTIPSRQIERFLPKLKVAGGKSINQGFINGIKGGLEGEEEAMRDGAELKNVVKGSAADKLGLKAGDKIIKIEDYPLLNFVRLVGVLSTYPAGSDIKITYKRGTEIKTIEAKLEAFPDDELAAVGPRRRNQPRGAQPGPQPAKSTGKLGVEIKDAESKDMKVLRQPAIVSKVEDNSAAKKAGLEVGDRVVAVNGEPIKNIFLFKMLMRNSGFNPGDKLKLKVLRGSTDNAKEVEVEATLQ